MLGYLLHLLGIVFLDYRLVGDGILLALRTSLLHHIVENGVHLVLNCLNAFYHIAQLDDEFLKKRDGILIALNLGGCHIIFALSCLEGGKHLGRLVGEGITHPPNIIPLIVGGSDVGSILLHSLFLA